MISLLLRVQRARKTFRSTEPRIRRHEPSISRKWHPALCRLWKLAGLPLNALGTYCRPWTSTAVIAGRKFWHGWPSDRLNCGGGLLWLLIHTGKLDPAAIASAARYWPYLVATLGVFYVQQVAAVV